MMMCLGQFVFSLNTLAYQDFQRQTQWRHPSNSRIGAAPARQYAGPGDDTITLQGLLAPELVGDTESLDRLREMADTGSAWPLVEGTGRVYGLYSIEGISEGRTLFFQDGAARRIEFTVNLTRVDDDRIDRLGVLA
jgi:phage protein U